MKIPLDVICVKTGVLCPICQRKVDEGIVKPIEVDVMRALLEAEEEMKELKDAEYEKSYEVDGTLIVVLKVPPELESNEMAKRIRQIIVRKLDMPIKPKIRVVLKSDNDIRKLASQLLAPLVVKGVNIVWLQDGSEKYVVRVKGSPKRLSLPKEAIEKILEEMTGHKVEIEFERFRSF